MPLVDEVAVPPITDAKTGPIQLALPIFAEVRSLPKSDTDKLVALHSPKVDSIVHFCLGPAGTNIQQAARRWSERSGLNHKSAFELTKTPEEAVNLAKAASGGGTLGVAWTCAVYIRENKIFFENPDMLPFFLREEMPLDGMSLAINRATVAEGLPECARVASHESPSPLLNGMRTWRIVLVESNAAAAELCAQGEVEACITTRTAAERTGLVIAHSFGHPIMIFFGGISLEGAKLVARAHASRKGRR